jgi:hypothetical protein
MRLLKRYAFLVLIAACAPRALSVTADHPANPVAPSGRLAGPPPALVGVADPAPTPVTEPAPAHDHHDPMTPVEPAKPDPAKVKADLLAVETAAYEKAKPVFEKFCAGCHSKGQKNATAKKLEHFDMTTYPFAGHHAMELGKEIRKVLGIGGGKPTMPKGKAGSVKGEDLALIAAWVDAFDASHAGGAHEGHGDHQGGHKH